MQRVGPPNAEEELQPMKGFLSWAQCCDQGLMVCDQSEVLTIKVFVELLDAEDDA